MVKHDCDAVGDEGGNSNDYNDTYLSQKQSEALHPVSKAPSQNVGHVLPRSGIFTFPPRCPPRSSPSPLPLRCNDWHGAAIMAVIAVGPWKASKKNDDTPRQDRSAIPQYLIVPTGV